MSAEQPPAPDYTALTGPQLLEALGDDASKWAAAFCQYAKTFNHSDIDEGWMIGWFANAIEHSHDVRGRRAKPQVQPLAAES
jgi:hypothetical protein